MLAFQQLCEHFDQLGVNYQAKPDQQMVMAVMGGRRGIYPTIIRAGNDNLLQVFGMAPFRVPAGCRPAVAEAIARSNYGLKLGKLEMDFEDGELRYQVATVIDDGLSATTIDRVIGTTLAMLDRYLPAVNSVIYANESPADAVKQAELQPVC